MLTINGAVAAEKPPPLAVIWKVPPPVPKLRVNVAAPRASNTPPSSVRKLPEGMPANIRLQIAAGDGGGPP